MNKTEALNVLVSISGFQRKAQRIKRFEKNPYVSGDSIAEHLSRLARMLVFLTPALEIEFPDDRTLIRDCMSCLLIHDDDEVIDGYDIATAFKVHNVKDEIEIKKFVQSVDGLDEYTRQHVISAFTAFRKKDTLAAKIAKALDNIANNQLVIEQKKGLINPDQARFAIEYALIVKGFSTTIDAVVDAQVEQIVEGRRNMINDEAQLQAFAMLIKKPSKHPLEPLLEKLKKLLSINIMKYTLNKNNINVHLEEL